MATKKDLVEAYSFSRRRLVTAFVSGAPGGREVEPTKPGRSLVGGLALAVLLIAGAAVIGILKSPSTVDLTQPGLISEEESGALYIVVAKDDPLRPVVNITSARLILGPGNPPQQVKHELIAKVDRDEAIGILGAPETPPATDELISSGWTACTGTNFRGSYFGTKINVAEKVGTEDTPDTGLVVSSGGKLYLVAEAKPDGRVDPRAYSYEIPKKSAGAILSAVAESTPDQAVPVAGPWLDLVTPGAPLTFPSFGIDASLLGTAPDVDVDLPAGTKVGDVVTVADASFLVGDGRTMPLDAFAAGVYTNLDLPNGFTFTSREGTSRPVTTDDSDERGREIAWPGMPTQRKTSGDYCLRLDASADQPPGARVATAIGGAASADDTLPGEPPDVSVQSGRGAMVFSGDWEGGGVKQATLLDDQGRVYPLIGQARDLLGYGNEPEVAVPDEWLDLFEPGVELSAQAARCPPSAEPIVDRCDTGE